MPHQDRPAHTAPTPLAWTSVGALLAALALPVPGSAQACTPPSWAETPARYVESIEPGHGPVGTTIQVRDEQLPVHAQVYLAMGQVGGVGYEAADQVETDRVGTLTGTVEVPDWGASDRPLFVMVFSEHFEPISFSDPFHVTDAQGRVRREGTVRVLESGCVGLESDDGITYALTGDEAEGLRAARGETVTVEGTVGGDACQCGNSLEVQRVVGSSGGR